MPVCCLMIANICTYISLYIRNTAILVNRKYVCISPHQLVNTCDFHLHTLKIVQNVRHNPSKDAQLVTFTFTPWKLNKMFAIFWKSGSVKLVCLWICRHENIKVKLDVQLWELAAQRLHQGLSETILVNTLTDVRELKNQIVTQIRNLFYIQKSVCYPAVMQGKKRRH